MSLSLFDSHCHLEDESFGIDIYETLARMKLAGVDRCLLAGSDMTSSERIVSLCKAHKRMYGAVGVHPHEATEFTDEALKRMRKWLALHEIVAVGEIGLDYHYDNSPRDAQKSALISQLDLACELSAPVVLHIREAHGDITDLLRSRGGRLPKGVLHCYSGSVESARQYLDWGFYISFAGVITYKNADKLRSVAAYCPADRILIETDSPYLAPVPYRGRRNEPSYVLFVAQEVARARGATTEEIADLTRENAMRLFGIAD